MYAHLCILQHVRFDMNLHYKYADVRKLNLYRWRCLFCVYKIELRYIHIRV